MQQDSKVQICFLNNGQLNHTGRVTSCDCLRCSVSVFRQFDDVQAATPHSRAKMSDFDPSPRSSKRRKVATYGSNRSTATIPSPGSPSILHSLSNTVSGISRRLFEPQTKQDAALSVDSNDGGEEPSRDEKEGLQKSGQAEEEQEGRQAYDADTGTERPVINKNEAVGQEHVITPVGKTKKATRSTKGSMEDDGTQRKSSARRPRPTDETMSPLAKAPIAHGPTRSSTKRQMIDPADAKGGIAERGTIGLAPTVSSSDTPAALPKQGKFSTRTSAPRKVIEEPAPENKAEDGADGVVVDQRSSGREKRKPRRYSEDVEDMAEQRRKQPIGILTPSKRNRTGKRKSVAFEDEEQQLKEQLNFRDIEERSPATDNAKQKSKTRSSHAKVAREAEPSGLSPKGVSEAEGDESEEDELVLEDTALLDMIPAPDSTTNITSILNSLPEADEDSHLTAIKAKVISRLTNSSLVPLANLATEYAKVHSLLKATITAGEGNSILVLGARGSGKTNLIQTALADVSHEHAEDFHVVRLNGFQQTDDKIALREIWRQLGREMQIEEDETNQVSSYADTMASLLHLLSHPEELAEVLEPDAPATTTKSVIFVLDEFDLFTTHPRQTLLYNLFDIAQAKKAPIAVIGCSTRVDVAESLEKRVKSRFSHRWVHLSQPKSFQAFEAVVEAALCLEVAEGELIDDAESSWRAAWNEYMKVRVPFSGVDFFY
jgi:energy-coupling factor transporter ATP-binding protein EcfA2